jgi:hypothetical protein
MVVMFQVKVFRVVCRVVLSDTSILSEVHSASIFRVKMEAEDLDLIYLPFPTISSYSS